MNATHLSDSTEALNFVPRHGVLVLVGYGISVSVDNGHLIINDGIGTERYQYRLPRIGHRLKRLVIVGLDGLITLAAVKWLRDQDVTLSFLERDGRVLSVVGPAGSSDAKLRRIQALATSNGVGLEICRRLVDAKLRGQERVLLERLNRYPTADVIARFRDKLDSVETIDAIRNLEGNAAASYFRAWGELPVSWPKADLRKIPEHWRLVGSRQSPLTGGPRLAATPVHAILNYVFALLEAETRLAISSLGLDAGLGLGLHTDTADRSSLAFDVLEPVRPQVEMWLLDWIASEPLRRADFFETAKGNVRLMAPMCAKLSETAPTWGRLVAPWAEYVARTLWAAASRAKSERILPTPLTQQHRREAKGRPPFSVVSIPRADHLCRGCGKPVASGTTHCATCAVDVSRTKMVEVAKQGRVASKSAESRTRLAATQLRQATARWSWDPSSKPDWLTDNFYTNQIQPKLTNATLSQIASAIGVSILYASDIRRGRRRPHPRHWVTLGLLVGIESLGEAPSL